jgi:hypothetical protein
VEVCTTLRRAKGWPLRVGSQIDALVGCKLVNGSEGSSSLSRWRN